MDMLTRALVLLLMDGSECVKKQEMRISQSTNRGVHPMPAPPFNTLFWATVEVHSLCHKV